MRWSYTDYYDVLDIEENATQDEIETARQNRVKETHPDSGGDREEFLLVQEAYNVLGDKKDRSQYDRLDHNEYVRKFNGTEFEQSTSNTNNTKTDSGSDSTDDQNKKHTTERTHINKQRRRRDRTASQRSNQSSSRSKTRSEQKERSKSGFNDQIQWENVSDDELLNLLRSIDPYEFEHFVAELWEYHGYETDVTTGSNDRGLDILARKSEPYEQEIALQVKKYAKGNSVGTPDIQQYSALRQQHGNINDVVIITTSSFSSGAKELADQLDVQVVNGYDLIRNIRANNAYNLFEKYTEYKKGDRQRSNRTNRTSTQSDQSGDRLFLVTISSFFVLAGHSYRALVYLNYAPYFPDSVLFAWFIFLVSASFVYQPYGIYYSSKYQSKIFGWPKYRWFYFIAPILMLIVIAATNAPYGRYDYILIMISSVYSAIVSIVYPLKSWMAV